MSLSSTSSLPNDQLAPMNSTVLALLSPEKHCAFPVYGLAVWMASVASRSDVEFERLAKFVIDPSFQISKLSEFQSWRIVIGKVDSSNEVFNIISTKKCFLH